jgi:hypothetical protein
VSLAAASAVELTVYLHDARHGAVLVADCATVELRGRCVTLGSVPAAAEPFLHGVLHEHRHVLLHCRVAEQFCFLENGALDLTAGGPVAVLPPFDAIGTGRARTHRPGAVSGRTQSAFGSVAMNVW